MPDDSIPFGYCHCGCGELAPISKRYIAYHHLHVRPITPATTLIWAKVKAGDPDECWPFLGYIKPNGYGAVSGGRDENGAKFKVYAHRAAWESANGRPPTPGMEICHTCDFRRCCNPAHLFEATHQGNMDDAVSKGRMAAGENHGLRKHPERHGFNTKPEQVRHAGESNGRALITADDVRTIRARYAAGGVTYKQLAAEYGLGKTTVGHILSRRNWAHVT